MFGMKFVRKSQKMIYINDLKSKMKEDTILRFRFTHPELHKREKADKNGMA